PLRLPRRSHAALRALLSWHWTPRWWPRRRSRSRRPLWRAAMPPAGPRGTVRHRDGHGYRLARTPQYGLLASQPAALRQIKALPSPALRAFLLTGLAVTEQRQPHARPPGPPRFADAVA